MLCLADTSAQELKFEWSQTWLEFCKDSQSKWALQNFQLYLERSCQSRDLQPCLECHITKPETSYWRGRICTINLPVLTSSDQLLSKLKRYTSLFFLNKFSEWGGQLYQAFPFSKSSLDKSSSKTLQFEGTIKHHSKLECLALSDAFTLV